jgi:uncharacterized protein YcgI (DUF1989 family)
MADTSPGVHDMLIAACDPERYRMLGAPGHASCADNVHNALAQIGLATGAVPQPGNVFMNIPVGTEGDLSWLPAVSRPGDAVTFAAATDCAVVLSACPMDLKCDQWRAADVACHRHHVTESYCPRKDLITRILGFRPWVLEAASPDRRTPSLGMLTRSVRIPRSR